MTHPLLCLWPTHSVLMGSGHHLPCRITPGGRMTHTNTRQTTALLGDELAPAEPSTPGRDSSISRLPLASRDELPEPLRKQLDQLESQLGYLPNWAAASALGGEASYHLNALLLTLL